MQTKPKPNRASRRAKWARMGLGGRVTPPAPGEGQQRVIAPGFQPDGFVYPRPVDQFFDKVIRVASIAASSTVRQVVFLPQTLQKVGWVRKLGYDFNNPHGYLQVQTRLLIAGAVPTQYQFETIDETTGAIAGSFPSVPLASIQAPTEVYIRLPAERQIDLEFINNSPDEAFTCAVRLWGWYAGD